MKPLNEFSFAAAGRIHYLLTDIDDTISTRGQIHSEAYQAIWDLQAAGIHVIPVTGRPAGWVDHIARMWPVRAVIGENGGFWFMMKGGKLHKHYLYSDPERREMRLRLQEIRSEILSEVPGCGLASDQQYREYDLAIDFCEDVPALPRDAVLRIRDIFQKHGATAKISSIHVNGWFGEFDKLTTTRLFLQQELGMDLKRHQEQLAFIGDSPNDEPMFKAFTHSVGVANVKQYQELMDHLPAWITTAENGAGFAELARYLIKAREANL